MSSQLNLAVEYTVLDTGEIDLLQPLWEKLNAHHAGISSNFSEELNARRFQDRKSQLLGDDKRVHILLVTASGIQNPIGYSIVSTTSSGGGEIDSMFVEEDYRNSGIGTSLMKLSLAWLDECGATAKSVIVLFENTDALGFYARFGFLPRSVNLFQKKQPQL